MILATAVIVGWDVWLYLDGRIREKDRPTISQVMASLPDRRPKLFALVFAAWIGLAVHWWFPTCP